ncbi:CitMHS family transporter [Oceanobacillus sp. M60]|uniref:CitMHS family transporter n=1 Tax=Oceanobacillus sp. FSL K6-0251 TaxID=2921602 RepID=UPI0030FCE2BE
MLALLGFLTIFVFLYLILTKKTSVIVALIIVPLLFGLFTGHTIDLGPMMLDGIIEVAPTAIMLAFAILYFGIMNQAGLFDPIIKRVLILVKGDPLKIVIGTAVIGMFAHLDGSGASTFLITIPALLPLYNRLKMSKLVLACVVALSAGTMNLLPWGGPTARASASLNIDTTDIFNPVIPAMLVGLLWVFFVAYLLGKRERKRLGIEDSSFEYTMEISKEEQELKRPKLFWFNLLLTIVLIVFLIQVWFPLPVVFMVGFVIALIVNYPNAKVQQERIDSLAVGVVTIVTIIFAAGIFTGVLSGTGMVEAMANSLVSIIPEGLGTQMAIILAIASMPLSLVFTPDAFYFGVLPILSEAAATYGISGAEMARAAILGQITTGFPISPLTPSTFLLIGLAGVDLADHQKFTFKWAFGTTIVMTIVCVLIGVIPF